MDTSDTSIQVRDAFDLAREFHQDLSELYAGLADHADRARVKLLLDWLSRHEAHLQTCLQRYESDRSHAVLDTWLSYAPEQSPFEGLDALDVDRLKATTLSVDAVAALALQLDEALVVFYDDIAKHADSEEVAKLFGTLATMARHDEQDLRERIDKLWRPHHPK